MKNADWQAVDPAQVGEGELTAEQRVHRENILDHYRNPRNRRAIEGAAASARDRNPLCGDEIEVFVALDGRKIEDISFQGKGCAISQASVSMLTRRLKGMDAAQAQALGQDYVKEMLGIPIGVVRMKCAMLGLRTAQKALSSGMADDEGKTEDMR